MSKRVPTRAEFLSSYLETIDPASATADGECPICLGSLVDDPNNPERTSEPVLVLTGLRRPPRPQHTSTTDAESASTEHQPTVIVRTMQCSHTFHKRCLFPWIKDHRSCPSCREPLYAPDRPSNYHTLRSVSVPSYVASPFPEDEVGGYVAEQMLGRQATGGAAWDVGRRPWRMQPFGSAIQRAAAEQRAAREASHGIRSEPEDEDEPPRRRGQGPRDSDNGGFWSRFPKRHDR